MPRLLLSPGVLLLAITSAVHSAEIPSPPKDEHELASEVPSDMLYLEFRGASLGQVLEYFSKKAGYIIANPIELKQSLTLVSKQPVTTDEAIKALNTVLIAHGYAVVIRGRMMHIIPINAAKLHNLPVIMGSDPELIPETDQLVTQVMPVRYATVKELAENFRPLIDASNATMAFNEHANVLILTDTQSRIRRIASIIHAIDNAVGGELAVKVFRLANADAENVAAVINAIYGSKNRGVKGQQSNSKNGSATGGQTPSGASMRNMDISAASDSGTNCLVVCAPPIALASLTDVVAQLDIDATSRQGVLVYKVRNGKASGIASSLNSIFQNSAVSTGSGNGQNSANHNRQTKPQQQDSATGSDNSSLDLSGQVRVVSDSASNSVMVLSLERNFDRIRKVLTDLDQPMRQVLIRVLMAEVSYEKTLDLGLELSGFNTVDSNASRAFTNFGTFNASIGSTLGMNGYILNSDQFSAALRALSTDTRFDVLSRPYILTTDNQQGVVNVSENVPVINGSRTDSNNNLTTTFDRQDVGIILTVTPQINANGGVLLDVNQVVSALTDQSIAVGAGINSPIIKKRTMTTRVAVDSGQTVVVGGLVHDSLTERISKVPLLGDIPLLGWLFRRTQNEKTKTELLLFLTPQVIARPDELDFVTRQIRSEMRNLDSAVEKGALQLHLDQLSRLQVGEPIVVPKPEFHQ